MKKEEPTAQAVPHPQHTVVMPSRSVPPTHGVPSTIGGDSYQPPSVLGTVLGNGPVSVAPSTQREQIVPGSASSASILAEIRKGPSDRLQIEIRAASGGMGAIDVTRSVHETRLEEGTTTAWATQCRDNTEH